MVHCKTDDNLRGCHVYISKDEMKIKVKSGLSSDFRDDLKYHYGMKMLCEPKCSESRAN